MIDYYLHKNCCLNCRFQKVCNIQKRPRKKCRCNGCVWLDKELHLCIFGLNYPKSISLEEIKRRIEMVNINQQNQLSEPFRRFVFWEKIE